MSTFFEYINRNRNSKSICLISENEMISYIDLFKKADEVTFFLQYTVKCKKNDIVCIISERSINMYSAVIGVLQAGAAYLLINTKEDNERIKKILYETKPRVILFAKKFIIKGFENQKYMLNDIFTGENREICPVNRDEDSLAYVSYTSGSTSGPKGIMIEDKNIGNYIKQYVTIFQVDINDRILQQSPINYDGFAEEFFVTLLAGNKMVFVNDDILKNGYKFLKYLIKYEISILPTTPLMLKFLNENKKVHDKLCLRLIISSGDSLKGSYFCNIMKYCSIYNMYGPTETTVCATYYHCAESSQEISIGKEIGGYIIQILGDDLKKVNNKEIGEIYIGGEGVARGYINPEENYRFVMIDDIKMYRTGDRAYRGLDGNIFFCGRIDRQVKIRGNRVELDEIEGIISRIVSIKQIVLLIIGQDEYIQLCLFYEDDIYCEDEIRIILEKEISIDYMRPSIIKKVKSIPMTDTGKIDSKALVNSISDLNYSLKIPIDEHYDINKKVFKVLNEIIAKMHGQICISMESSFLEIGVNSLLFLQLLVGLENAFEIEFGDEINYHEMTSVKDLCNLVYLLLKSC